MKSKRGRKFMLNHAKSIALTEDKIERLIHGKVLINKPYETMPLEVAINKQVKEKEMPDMKSELSKVLNQWDKHEDEIRTQPKENQVKKDYGFKPTNNVSRETFNYIKAHPMQRRKVIMEMLALRGFNPSSVDSLISQMTRANMLERMPDGTYRTISDEFQSIKVKIKRAKTVVQPQVQPSAGIAALESKAVFQDPLDEAHRKHAVKQSLILNRNWTPEKAIENLNVIQARALYDELKKIFGG